VTRRVASWVVVSLLAAACAGATSPTPLASTAPTSGSDAPSRSPALPVGDALTVRVIGDGPVIEGGVDGPEGYPNDYPGAVVRDPDGTYHLYIAWFAAAPGDEVVTHSTSADAIDWDVGKEPIHDDLGLEMRYPGADARRGTARRRHLGPVRLGCLDRRSARGRVMACHGA
jgi:hypothetical protein